MVYAATMEDRQDNQQLLSIDVELWLFAEERAQEILCTIQPNVISEVHRKEVIEYVQRLIRGYYGAEVFPFGSVPLKTYLPDGDIDFTALSLENAEEDLAKTVYSLLESNEDSEFQVKDIQHIRAQVQVVKCTVKNIAVDISFNQMAGLFALRFLEQVDQLLGKNHLFKRSIILIKAWCYYESRILGAHHGLLSTYAVEALVLYIINRYHSSVRGPLEVLYRFLDYFSTFDWESNYVSVDGPKPLSSLPEIVDTPECERGGFLLDSEFLRKYREMCSISVKACETTKHEFPTKHLNILDPLRNDNNLGRSVNKANLHRIRFALSFGARKLREILTLPGERMGAALERFFMNTLDRNGKGQRPDIEVPIPAFGTGRSEESVLSGDCDSYYGALQFIQMYGNYAMLLTALPSSPSPAAHADLHAVSTQQNWSMFYQGGTNVYVPIQNDVYVPTQSDVYAPAQTDVYVPSQTDVFVPTQTFYHPNASQATYSLEEMGKSRGTGTYIPDVTHNSYWDMRAKVNRPRRYAPVGPNLLPRSPSRKQLAEFHSDEITDKNGNSGSFELADEEFPLLSSTPKSPLTKQLAEVHSNETNYAIGNSGSFELADEEFPLLSSICQNGTSLARDSVPVTDISEKARNSSSSQLNIEFGIYRKPESLPELSLPTKDEKEDAGVLSSNGTMPVVSSVAVESKEGFLGSDEEGLTVSN